MEGEERMLKQIKQSVQVAKFLKNVYFILFEK